MADTSHQTEQAATPSKSEIIRSIYAEGGSDVEVAASLDLTIGRFRELCDELPELNALVELGRTVSEAWWMGKGRSNLWNKEFNGSLYNFQMKNRFGWADKVDTTDKSVNENVNMDQMMADLQKAIGKLSENHPELIAGKNLKSA